jgi:hypothetical protein
MNIETFAHEVYKNAVEHGFHPEQEGLWHWLSNQCNNMHSEVSELWDSYRADQFNNLCDKAEKMRELGLEPLTCAEEEYADIIIRALDQCMRLRLDIVKILTIKHAYNKTRPFKHGKIN